MVTSIRPSEIQVVFPFMQGNQARAGRYERSFLKWAGNKYRVLPWILPLLEGGERIVEPFAGSAVVFLNSNYKKALICDANRDLIDLFQILKTDGLDFIKETRKLFTSGNNTPARFNILRKKFNVLSHCEERSALFVYLNRHGFNGLCRYNKSGDFNVPFGRYTKPYFPQYEMEYFAEKAKPKSVVFQSWSFEKTFSKLKSGDVVYADPPYVPLSKTANFTSYASGGFGSEEQEKLALLAAKASKKPIRVLISNHNVAETRKLYGKHIVDKFPVRRNISCDGANRGKAAELLALYGEL